MHEVNPETVGQAIWLKDVNGNEVFEGDIVEEVEPEWGEPSRAVAVFEDNNFVFGYIVFYPKLRLTIPKRLVVP